MRIISDIMAEMGKEAKVVTGGIIATIALIIGGIFFINKNQQNETKPSNPSLLVRENSFKEQAKNEKAVLVEFADLQCPSCASYHPLIVQAKEEFKDSLTYVFRHFPLSQHKNAEAASYAFEAAGIQGKYKEMQDKLFSSQAEWAVLENPTDKFLEYAKEMKLNTEKFRSDMNSASVKKKVEDDTADGLALKVNSTPTFYLNGTKTKLFQSYDELKSLINFAISQGTVVETGDDEEVYHAHFDLKVYMNGKALDLTKDQYQSTHEKELDPNIHLHDKNGKVVHVHKEGVKLEQLFKSVNLSLSGKTYVNGVETSEGLNYVPKDLDRIVFVSGSATEGQLKTMTASVSDDACIYSLKCPERGTPPPEACVGGLGTGCD